MRSTRKCFRKSPLHFFKNNFIPNLTDNFLILRKLSVAEVPEDKERFRMIKDMVNLEEVTVHFRSWLYDIFRKLMLIMWERYIHKYLDCIFIFLND